MLTKTDNTDSVDVNRHYVTDNVISMLSQHFEKLGFNQKEQRVFLALAELGRATASQISKESNIPRATVYALLESLIEKGVISEERVRSGTIYATRELSAFLRLLDKEREELDGKVETAQELIALLSPYLKHTALNIPRIMVFEGKRNIENMFYEYLPEWRESLATTEDNTLWGYQDHTVVEQYRKWHEYLWKTRNAGERIRLFSNSSDIEKELEHRIDGREVRAIPKGIQFKSSIWLYGDYILMCMTREKPHFAFQLKESIFASNLRAVFQLMWKAKF